MANFEKIFSLFTAIFFMILTMTGCDKDAEKIDAFQFELPGDAYEVTKQDNISIHDPSLFKAEDGTYYIYGSHIASAKSKDLTNWKNISAGVVDSNRTLVPEESTLRAELKKAFAWEDAVQVVENDKISLDNYEGIETNVWASDVFYNKAMKKYCYYACSSVWGSSRSVIWFATSDSPEGTFKFEKCIVYSGFNRVNNIFGKAKLSTNYKYTNIPSVIKSGAYTKAEIEKAKFFSPKGKYSNDYGVGPNCIDPHPFYDENGGLWLVYGSWSGGIYVLPLDEKTGMPDYEKSKTLEGSIPYFGVLIVRTNEMNNSSGEGPYITYDPETGYYHFFLTYGGLGRMDGYNIREYRSKNPWGPYEDNQGNPGTADANTGVKISGNYTLDGTTYLSPGHNSVFIDDDGKVFNCYHVRFGHDEGYFETKINQMVENADGWLVTLPLEYSGETAKAVGNKDITGTYTLWDFGNTTVAGDDIEKITEPSQTVKFNKDGSISGFVDYTASKNNTADKSEAVEGSWTHDDGTYYITMVLGEVRYSGVAVEGADGRMMLSFTGNDNSSVWAVKNTDKNG